MRIESREGNNAENSIAKSIELDTRGLRCPEPLMRVRAKIRSLSVGQHLLVWADDPSTIRDIPAFCEHLGHTLLIAETAALPYRYVIERG